MVRVDYHLHTWASYDCSTSTAEVLDRAVEAGLDVVCVNDHDTVDGAVRLAAAAPPGLKVVVGCEFTCQDGSHVIGLGLREGIAERRILPLLEAIRDQGGRVVIPHPFRRGSGLLRNEVRRPEELVAKVLALTDALECFNARDTAENNKRSLELALSYCYVDDPRITPVGSWLRRTATTCARRGRADNCADSHGTPVAPRGRAGASPA